MKTSNSPAASTFLPTALADIQWHFEPAEQFAAHADAWQQLNIARQDHILLRPEFISNCLKHFALQKVMLAIATMASSPSAAPTPVAMLLIESAGAFAWSTFSPSQLPITPLVAAQHLNLNALMRSLTRALPGRIQILALEHLDTLLFPFENENGLFHAIPYIDTCEIVAPVDGWVAYMAGLSGNLQSNIRKRRNKASKERGEVRLEMVCDTDQIAEACNRYADLESAGWKAGAGTAMTRGGSQTGFYIDLLKANAGKGCGAVFLLYFGEELAAARLIVWNDDMVVILKTAFNETLRAYGPGQLLLHATVEWISTHRPQTRRIETYGPANELQRSFATGVRQIFHLNVYRNGFAWRLHTEHMARRQRQALASAAKAEAAATTGASAAPIVELTRIEDFPVAQRPDADFFQTVEWFSLLGRSLAPGGKGLVFPYFAADDLHICVPLISESGSFRALANYYSSLYGAVESRAADLAPLGASLSKWLARNKARRIHLQPAASDSSLVLSLSNGLRQAGFWVDQYFAQANWYQPCAGLTFREYLAHRPSRLRHTIQRTSKALKTTPGYAFKLYATASDDVEKGIADYAEVYAHSWKKPEPFADFIPELCRMAAGKGWLRLGVTYLNERPIAAQIWIVKNRVALIYKLAYDRDFAKLGVGTVLQATLTEHVLEIDKVEQIDFLTGDEPYKSEWMSNRRERIGLIAFNPTTLTGLLGAMHHFGGRLVRRLAQSALQLIQRQPGVST